MESLPGAKPENLAKAREMTLAARPDPNSLVLFPEMFATGYGTGTESPEVPGFLQQLANDTGCIMIGGGMVKAGGITTNHVGIYAPGKANEIAGYNKMHPFFPEQGTFTAGQDITLYKISDFIVSPTICFDLRFPELYREATARGAQLFTVHASWPAKRSAHWETLLKARAIENQAYIAAVNNVSADGTYTGDSQVIDPQGNIVVKAEPGKECVVSASVDIDFLNTYRKDFPVLPEHFIK